ncbi:MAG: HEAT repeat domain-containing protein [Acidobacteria bacterium]|nr:HEAT repeat domain-containing protein [Acidobacteriota bacterium]
MKKYSFLILLLLILNLAASAQDKSVDEQYVIKVRPLIEPCEELKDADDAAVAKAIKDISTADSAGKIRLAGELGKSCHKKSAEPLVALLDDKDPLVKIAAVEALAHLGDEETIEALIQVGKDPDWRVRFATGPALCAFQKQKSSYAALNYLGVASTTNPVNEEDMRARGVTFLAINQMRDVSFSRKTLFYLFSAQDSKDEGVRKVARETLMALKNTRNGSRELIALLKQSLNPNYRRNCAYWLGQLKVEVGRDVLTDVAANDVDETVKKTAAEALKLLGPGEVETESPAVTTAAKKKGVTAPAQPVKNNASAKSLKNAPAKK